MKLAKSFFLVICLGTLFACAGSSDTGQTDGGATNTGTPTPVATATAAVTPTVVPTNGPTAVPTNTPTNIPTSTPTATPTSAPTNTPVPTVTPTETPTPSPTATNTPLPTPTATPTSTPTSTPTPTPSATPSATPTSTPTASPTPVLSSDATLVDLTLSVGSLSPSFSPATDAYDVALGFFDSLINVVPTANDAGATIAVEGMSVVSGDTSQDIAVPFATSGISIEVTAEDGVTQVTYVLSLMRSGQTMQEAYVKASNAQAGDRFGRAVAIDGDTMVVGTCCEDSNGTGESNNSLFDPGAAYVFVRSGSTWTQQAYLKASNPGTDDYFGSSVAISGDTIVVGAFFEDSAATGVDGDQTSNAAANSGAAYVFVRSGTTWTQQAYLKASNTGAGDQFGESVAISGGTIAVGAKAEDGSATGVNGADDNLAADAGAAYVFTRSGTTWSFSAYLKASNTGAGDEFGESTAISSNTILVGADNEDSNATLINGDGTDNSAASAGAAYVFANSGTWSQQAYLKAANAGAGDQFGEYVSLSGSRAIIGAQNEDSNAVGVNGDGSDNSSANSGAAYLYSRSGSTWAQAAYLKASNTGANDRFGVSVGISGEAVIVGANGEDSSATTIDGDQGNHASLTNFGAAYTFSLVSVNWAQASYLKAANADANDQFGLFVAISDDTPVVGTINEESGQTGVNPANTADDSAAQAGAVYVFR